MTGSVSSLAIARFLRLPRRSSATWQGGVLRLPMWVEERKGAASRPRGGAWVDLETGLANVKIAEDDAVADWQLALDAAIELGLRFAQARPARLDVDDEALGRQIASALGDRELAVTGGSDLAAVKAMLREMARHAESGSPVPDALGARGVTVTRMRAFAAAARDFHVAAPWRHLTDADLIHVEAPEVAPGLRCVTVLGAGGQVFGLGFFPSPKEYARLVERDDPAAPPGRQGRWSVLFGPATDLPFGDLDLWADHGLALAGPAAYPLATWLGPKDTIRRPDAAELSDLEAILLALAQTSEEEMDRGRWSREVQTHDGPRTVTLAIPELLEPLEAPPARGRPGIPDRRAMERILLEAQRLMAGSEFASEAEATAALQARLSGPLDTIPSTARTPLERAQDLTYRAVEAEGRRRLQLARKALEISPDCADAYVLLAEAAPDTDTACGLYAKGVAAGERALAPAVFTEEAGHFWGLVETRPYMRARLGLAQCLEALGRREEAIEHYRDLLRLNPGDNQGVRDFLLPALLLTGHDEEAGALLEQFGEDPSAVWHYGRALWAFRREGESRGALEHLRSAIGANRHAARYLAGVAEWSGPAPHAYAPGSEEEAAICEEVLGPAWQATPGADRWLQRHAPSKSGRRRRR